MSFAKRIRSAQRQCPQCVTSAKDPQEKSQGNQKTSAEVSRANPTSTAVDPSGASQRATGLPASRPGSMSGPPSGKHEMPPKTEESLPKESLILLLVPRGDDFKLKEIDVKNRSCHQFYHDLRNEYFKLRGCLFLTFSPRVYAHCDFWRVSQYSFIIYSIWDFVCYI